MALQSPDPLDVTQRSPPALVEPGAICRWAQFVGAGQTEEAQEQASQYMLLCPSVHSQ